MQCIEDFCANEERFNKCFHLLIQIVFSAELVNKETIFRWEAGAGDNEDEMDNEETIEIKKKFLVAMKPFLDHLREDDDDDDDDSSGEEESEEST